ncbi:MAG: RdgB/HAM1 family non-canonical purine NTP pyrophosphatase [Phycisphaerae bacterium]
MSAAGLLVATGNPAKLREMRAVLGDLRVSVLGLGDVDGGPPPIEDAETFEGNAMIKALHYAACTGHWTLADDSGLEVDALALAPGVHSARYAGPACDPAANNARLIEQLRGVPPEARTARFRCAVALARPGRVLATARGAWEGLIVETPRGKGGFGYDPHFLVVELGVTAAEMTPEEKNAVSHRGQALRAIRPDVERLLRSDAK